MYILIKKFLRYKKYKLKDLWICKPKKDHVINLNMESLVDRTCVQCHAYIKWVEFFFFLHLRITSYIIITAKFL